MILGLMRSGKLCHPTASQVYDAVRKSLPNVSLGTVYRNLNALSMDGEIARIDTEGADCARYDSDISAHSHFTCRECGAIYDAAIDNVVEKRLICALGNKFSIESINISLSGLCPKCNR